MSLYTHDGDTQTVTQYGFEGLLSGNASLYNVSDLDLPALSVASRGYENMFVGCSNITVQPYIAKFEPTGGTTCRRMFYQCSSLNELDMNVTKDAAYLYSNLAVRCTSLKRVKLSFGANEHTDGVLTEAFYGCSSLSAVYTNRPSDKFNMSWLYGVSSGGSFYAYDKDFDSAIARGASTVPTSWQLKCVNHAT